LPREEELAARRRQPNMGCVHEHPGNPETHVTAGARAPKQAEQPAAQGG